MIALILSFFASLFVVCTGFIAISAVLQVAIEGLNLLVLLVGGHLSDRRERDDL
jgi:hypothetical protein